MKSPLCRSAAEQLWQYIINMRFEVREESQSLINVRPKSSSPATAKSSNSSRSRLSNDNRSDNSSKALEVTSPQVSQERMGSLRVMDLPRYHSLVEDFVRLADRWMAVGQLMGPANIGGGYLLNLQIPLSASGKKTHSIFASNCIKSVLLMYFYGKIWKIYKNNYNTECGFVLMW